MVTTVHLLSGAAIGFATGDVMLAAVTSFTFHYVLDAVPHASWTPVKNYREGGIRRADKIDLLIKSLEPLVGLVLVSIFLYIVPAELFWSVFVGIVFGWLPDALTFLEWKFGILRPPPFRQFELAYHRHTNSLRGILPQILVSVGALAYLSSAVLI